MSHFLFSLAVSQVLAQLESLNHFEGHPLPKRFSLIPPPPPPAVVFIFFSLFFHMNIAYLATLASSLAASPPAIAFEPF